MSVGKSLLRTTVNIICEDPRGGMDWYNIWLYLQALQNQIKDLLNKNTHKNQTNVPHISPLAYREGSFWYTFPYVTLSILVYLARSLEILQCTRGQQEYTLSSICEVLKPTTFKFEIISSLSKKMSWWDFSKRKPGLWFVYICQRNACFFLTTTAEVLRRQLLP